MKKLSWILIVLMALTLFSNCSTSQKVTDKPVNDSISLPEKYNELCKKADDYFNNRQWRKAEKTYKKAAKYKADFTINYNIGVSAYNRGRYNEALKYFAYSIMSRPTIEESKMANNMVEKSRKHLQEREKKVATVVGTVLGAAVIVPVAAAMGATEESNVDPQYQAWMNYRNSGLPGASTISFEDFKRANARAAANGYQIGNSSSATSSSNNSSSITKTKDCPHCVGNKGKCSTCNGRGWIYAIGSSDHLDCPNCNHGECQWCNGTGTVTTH